MIEPKCERTKSILVDDDFINALKNAFSGSKAERLPANSHYPLYIGEDLISQLKSGDNQIIWGRRGTGKTHLLKAFNQCINEDKKNYSISYYISCDNIKFETPIAIEFRNDVEKMKYCARRTFKQFMRNLVNQLIDSYEEILRKKEEYVEKNFTQKKQMKKKIDDVLIDMLTNIEEGIPVVVDTSAEIRSTDMRQKARSGGLEADVSLEIEKLSVKASNTVDFVWKGIKDKKVEITKVQNLAYEFSFQKFRESLSCLLKAMEIENLYLCIDELWLIDDKSTISYQPLFLEYLRQTCFCIPNISIKIASIRETTKLNAKNTAEKNWGIQPGQDIIELANLDSMRDSKDELVEKYIQILVSRINYFSEKRRREGISDILYDGEYVVSTIFSQKRYLETLIYLAHGLPRNILYVIRTCLANISHDLSRYYLHVYMLSAIIIDNFKDEKRASMPMNENSVYMIIHTYLLKKKEHFFLISTDQVKQYQVDINNLLYTEIIHRIPSSLTPSNIMDTYKAYFIDSGKYLMLIKEKEPNSYDRVLNEFNLSVPNDLNENYEKYVVDLNMVPNNFIECPSCSAAFNAKHPVYIKHHCCVTCGFDFEIE